MTMEVEFNANSSEEASEGKEGQNMAIDDEKNNIISFLTHNESICFKSQQKWEADLTVKEKSDIALNIFDNSKLNFLMRFGKYLKREHLEYFEQFTQNYEPDNEEIDLVLKDLYRNVSESAHHVDVKNRRYAALLQMIAEDSYFSEIEMMKRNPLLYEQLVGQYLTVQEKKERDKYKMDEEVTFVKILMEGIERDNAEIVRKNEEEKEDNQMEEEDDTSDEDSARSLSPVPSTSRWGEFEEDKTHRPKPKSKAPAITAQERLLLKQEFITTMYQNFLDGKDEDFNYDTVDNNSSFDNINEIDHDEEDKYFASEDPEVIDTKDKDESSEDELDIYMSALNQHPAVTQLAQDLKNL
ncbi:coiled-coil domain-containing protein 97 [Anoplophora glabripennis]|nr:coiled-coil domain-containing protein 97 [Anoplophora glabripennis]